MDEDNILKLQLITLFDSICFGLIYAFINPHLLQIGADHLTIGIFAVMYLISQLISKDVTNILTCNSPKSKCLFHVCAIALASHILITLTSNYWYVIFARCLFGVTNQVSSISKDLLLDNIPKDNTRHYIAVHNILSSVGYIIGPVISGCLFSLTFHLSCLMAATLTLINIWLILSINDDEKVFYKHTDKTLIEKSVETCQQIQEDIKHSKIETNWDLIALKYLFSASINVFFSKFTQILKYNFDSSSILIGYTTAYMNGLTFAATYGLQMCKVKRTSDTLMFTKISFVTFLLSLLIACYSPSYYIYSIICIPMIFSRNYINVIWNDLFYARKNSALDRLNGQTAIAAGLTIPILFGVVCDVIGHYAVILFSVLPIIASIYIYEKHTIPFYTPDKIDELSRRTTYLSEDTVETSDDTSETNKNKDD